MARTPAELVASAARAMARATTRRSPTASAAASSAARSVTKRNCRVSGRGTGTAAAVPAIRRYRLWFARGGLLMGDHRRTFFGVEHSQEALRHDDVPGRPEAA